MYVVVLVASTIKPQRRGILYRGQGSEIHCQHRSEADVEERAAYPRPLSTLSILIFEFC